MISTKFAICSQKAILEKGTNNLSLINIINRLEVVSLPSVMAEFAFALITKRDKDSDPDDVELDLTIQQEDNILLKHKGKITYQGKDLNTLVVTIHGLLIQSPSPIVVTCKKDDSVLSKIEIEVVIVSPKVEQQENSA